MLSEDIIFAALRRSVYVARKDIPGLLEDLRNDRNIVKHSTKGEHFIKGGCPELSKSAKLFFGDSISEYRIPVLINTIDRLISGIEEIELEANND